MRKILIDTDIGIDCDDAIALALAISLQKQGLIEIAGVSVVTAREGATEAVSAIFEYFNASTDVGRYFGKDLECDKENVYAKAVKDKFGGKEYFEDSVKYLRRKLATSQDKITLVAIGPLTNVASLLESEPDEISPLKGVDLVKNKVEALYSMGGNFVHVNAGEEFGIAEWNVFQDVNACKTIVNLCPVELVFSPYETGYEVLTGKSFDFNDPVGYSIKMFFEAHPSEFCGKYVRCSWDPIAVAAAAGVDLLDYSEYGKVSVDSNGVMFFKKGKGKHRYLIKRVPANETEEELEKLYSYIKNQ